MTIGIYTNKRKDEGLINTKNFIGVLKKHNIEYVISRQLKEDFPDIKCYDDENIKMDLLAVFGGDGTILRAVKKAVAFDIPILGINLGNLGFLNEIGNYTAEEALNLIIQKKYQITKRMLLNLVFNGHDNIALNDIVIRNSNQQISNVIKLEAYLDDILIDKFIADGLIISTPTGSTAYSLSAGGPVLSPDLDVLVITAICPHTLHNRPIVVSDKKKIRIKLIEENANVFADGQLIGPLNTGKEIEITKSGKICRFISIDNNDFYTKLLTKLNKWSNTD